MGLGTRLAVTWLCTGPGRGLSLEVDGVRVHDRKPEVKLVKAIKTNLCIQCAVSNLGSNEKYSLKSALN